MKEKERQAGKRKTRTKKKMEKRKVRQEKDG